MSPLSTLSSLIFHCEGMRVDSRDDLIELGVGSPGENDGAREELRCARK